MRRNASSLSVYHNWPLCWSANFKMFICELLKIPNSSHFSTLQTVEVGNFSTNVHCVKTEAEATYNHRNSVLEMTLSDQKTYKKWQKNCLYYLSGTILAK